ncbi:MAG: hypothetical protein LBC74_00490 [Planctomycetaceae bacterium]|nr:hypothetical protein [Planctomycetaceae bacterium]
MKVITIIIKRRVAGQGDFVTISDVENVSSVIVGQKVELKVEVKPDNTTFTNVWTITGGNQIKDYQPTNEKAEIKNLTNTDYAQKTIAYYNTAGGNTTAKTKVTIDGKDKEKEVGFTILSPALVNIKYEGKNNYLFQAFCADLIHIADRQILTYNLVANKAFMEFNAAVNLNNCKRGEICYVQLVTVTQRMIPSGGNAEWRFITNSALDIRTVKSDWRYPSKNETIKNGQRLTITTVDSPSVPLFYQQGNLPLTIYDKVSVFDSFNMYVMYRHSNDCIWITVGKLDWRWAATTDKLRLVSKLAPYDEAKNKDKVLFGSPCNTLPEWDTNVIEKLGEFQKEHNLKGSSKKTNLGQNSFQKYLITSCVLKKEVFRSSLK